MAARRNDRWSGALSVLAGVLLLAACGSSRGAAGPASSPVAPRSPDATSSATPSPSASPSATATATPSGSAAPATDARAVVASAIDGMDRNGNYHAVMTGAQDARRFTVVLEMGAPGRRHVTMTSDSGSIETITIGDTSWTRTGNGPWSADTSQPSAVSAVPSESDLGSVVEKPATAPGTRVFDIVLSGSNGEGTATIDRSGRLIGLTLAGVGGETGKLTVTYEKVTVDPPR